MKEKFDIIGMSCAACQSHVNNAVKNIKGVNEVDVNLLSNNMVVDFDEKICSIDNIINEVSKAGYKAIYKNNKKQTNNNIIENKDNKLLKLIVSFILLFILMYFSMGNMMFDFPVFKFLDHRYNPLGFALIQFLLVLPIIYIYRNYFINGFKLLFKGHPNMDSLIAIGATFSILYGIFALFMISYAQSGIINDINNTNKYQQIIQTYHDSLYFESAGMILTLVSLGKYLEGLSKKKTTKAISRLIELAPKEALILKDGNEVTTNVENINIGDIVIVKKGDAIPIDGIIIEGNGSINQANITGESMPVYKTVNDEVFSSTILESGYIKIKASKLASDTSIANIIKLVEEASNSKAPISKLADKISAIFVPIIFAISLLTFIINLLISKNFELSFNFAITVIVIACPCALGLATPVAIMVGSGVGASNGLLIKNAMILEKTSLIKTVVLDKTGTITLGKPELIDYENFNNDDNLLSIIYSIENKSEHPLALSIVNYAINNNATLYDVNEYQTIEGKGIVGIINNDTYYIGNKNIFDNDSLIDTTINSKIDNYSKQGKTPLLVIKNNEIVAILTIKDKVKETSKLAINELKKNKIDVIMLTGDNYLTATSIASEVNIDKVIADVKPIDKQNVIKSYMKDDKHLLAMVGDGVNDALALTSANIAIALGGGSDIAIESSDIILLRNDLIDVLNVINLSKKVLKTIKINLFWAFFYNFICVFIATGVLYYINGFKINPMIGSLAMSISSVSVVLNALTINTFKSKKINTFKEENVMNSIEIKVEGMMCSHCTSRVENTLKAINGVSDAKASVEKKNVIVTCESNVSKNDLLKAINDIGYEAK